MALNMLVKTIRDLRTVNLLVRRYIVSFRQTKILTVSNKSLVSQRTFFWKFFSKPSAEKLKTSDSVPEPFQMIYRIGMNRYLLSAQIISVGASLILVLWVMYNTTLENSMEQQKWGNPSQPKPNADEFVIYISAFILAITVLQIMVYKMPIRIYNHARTGEYIFVFYGVLPTSTRQLNCKLHDISKIQESGVLPWRDNRIEISQKQKAIVLTNCFRRPSDLNIMLGYEKPEDNS